MKNQAKPILTIGLPDSMNRERSSEISENLQKKLSDYHVLVYPTKEEEIKFQTFYDKDFTEVNLEELKQLIKEEMK